MNTTVPTRRVVPGVEGSPDIPRGAAVASSDRTAPADASAEIPARAADSGSHPHSP